MITSSDQLFTSLPLPSDPRETNLILNGDIITVETISQYLSRVSENDRYIGLQVTICSPPGNYTIQNYMSNAELGNIQFDRYEFSDISDSGLTFVHSSVVIINNLTTGGVNNALSAQQGVLLKELIDTLQFLALVDTPNSYESHADDTIRVSSGEEYLEFIPRTFIYDQGLPSTVWNIVHPLDKYPSVTIVNSANDAVEGAVRYISKNNITLTFNAAFSGRAFLN